MYLRHLDEPHVAIDTSTSIPTGIDTVIGHLYCQHILLARFVAKLRNVKAETLVAIVVEIDLAPVEPYGGVVVCTFEIQHDAFPFVLLPESKPLAVPALSAYGLSCGVAAHTAA